MKIHFAEVENVNDHYMSMYRAEHIISNQKADVYSFTTFKPHMAVISEQALDSLVRF